MNFYYCHRCGCLIFDNEILCLECEIDYYFETIANEHYRIAISVKGESG